MRRLFLMLPVVLGLAACQTLIKDSYQKISVHTPGVEGAECILETSKTKYVVLTPGVVQVDRVSEPLTMTCQKAGYYKAVEILDSRIKMMPAQLNILNGLIGVAYDIASGSIYTYPEVFVVDMIPNPDGTVPLPLREIRVLQLKEVPVTAEDVKEARIEAAEEDGDDELLEELMDDDAADKAMSKSLRK